jgi:hypothetical protein
MAWLVVTFVVVHRIACIKFDVEQLRLRAVVLTCATIGSIILTATEVIPMAAPITQLGGVVLFGVAVMNLMMALHNQRQRGY